MITNQTKIIQRRIVLFAMYGVIITCIFSVSFISVPYYLDLKTYIKKELLLRSSNKALVVGQLLYRFEQQAKSISGRIHARHLLAQYVRGEMNKEQVKTRSEKIIAEAVRQAVDIAGVIRVSRNNEILLRVGQEFEDSTSRAEYNLNNKKTSRFGAVITLKDGTKLLIYYSPILSHKGHSLGLDIIALRIDKLRKNLEPEKLQSTTLWTAFYAGSDTTRLDLSRAKSNFSKVDDQQAQSLAKSLFIGSNKKFILSSGKTTNIYTLGKVENTNWLVASKVNRAELYSPLTNRMFILLVISVSITGIGVIVMRRIMRPLSSQVVEPSERSRLDSETRYRALFESAGDAIFLMQHEVIVDCNQKTLDIFRCERDKFIGKTPKDFSPEVQPDGTGSQEKVLKLITSANQGVSQYFEWIYHCPDNSQFPAEVSLTRINVSESNLIQVIVRDISERKRAEETIYHMAYHDALTGLVNRHEFEKRLLHTIKGVKERGSDNAMLYIDLDQFKVVNDSCGHAAGDKLLKNIAKLLLNPVRERDTVARLGGDEFGILLENCTPSSAIEIATEIVAMIGEFRFLWEDKTFSVGASIGISLINASNQTIGEVMKTADMACYMAKEHGRNRVHMFTSDDEDFLQRKTEMSLVTQIHDALENDKFMLYTQSIVSLDIDDENHEFNEILVRMIDKTGAIIPAREFVVAAELYNLMPAIDRWVIHNAFSHIANSKLSDTNNKKVMFFINLSGTSFSDESFLEFVQVELKNYNIDPGLICFEVTETAAIANIRLAQKFLHVIKSLGCNFALDDFGSGLSSFKYLKELSVDYLKIDGAFVRDMLIDQKDFSIVKAIAQVGYSMNIYTIAESVENEEVANKLKEIGVNYAQGCGISEPKPLYVS